MEQTKGREGRREEGREAGRKERRWEGWREGGMLVPLTNNSKSWVTYGVRVLLFKATQVYVPESPSMVGERVRLRVTL